MADGEKTILIDCADCESKVAATIMNEKTVYDDWNDENDCFMFLQCPSCKGIILARSTYHQVDAEEWVKSKPTRLWPAQKNIAAQIPEQIRKSIEEGQRCFDAQAFNACVVMCGRALEAVCKNHGVKMISLIKALKEMKEKGIIDGRMFEWGDELRKVRNVGAHAADVDVERADARDMLDFTVAIGEYVYVLTEKYRVFQDRKAKKSAPKKEAVDIPF